MEYVIIKGKLLLLGMQNTFSLYGAKFRSGGLKLRVLGHNTKGNSWTLGCWMICD